MNNHLSNGTVLPYGLLGVDAEASMGAFNRAYKNTSLRMGIVVAAYSYNDPKNYSGLCTEYDVLVMEQNENVSCTNILYRNCISSEGMGSVADFFEKNLRFQTFNGNANGAVNTSNQNGALALIQCLDSFTNKAMVVGAPIHPDRQTTLVDTQPRLTGEYNGVNIAVNPDGSTALTFNGATDSYGVPTDPTQGVTTVQVAKDGSFSVDNTATTFMMSKSGDVTITASGTVNINTQGDTNVTASGTTVVEGNMIKLGANASHALILGDVFEELYNSHVHPTVLGPSGPPVLPMDSTQLSQKVTTE